MNLYWWSEVLGERFNGHEVLFEPSSDRIVEEMLALAEVNSADLVYDLGCGDGRIVIAAALRGAQGVGIDIDPVRIQECRSRMAVLGASDRVCFMEGDLYSTDFSPATVLTLYLLPEANLRLRPRILESMRPGSRVVSHSHDMGSWEPDRKATVQGHGIYCWIVPADAVGVWEWAAPSASGKTECVRLKIRQKFQKLRGALEIRTTRGMLAEEPELRGSRIRLTTVQAWRKKRVTSYLNGMIEGDEIAGCMIVKKETGMTRIPWRARRISAQPL